MKFNFSNIRLSFAGLICLLLPFLATGYLIVQAEYQGHHTAEYRVAVTGYDPRDFLTGHYLRFRYQWPRDIKDTCHGSSCVACFSGPPINPQIEFHVASDLTSCSGALDLSPGSRQPPSYLLEYHVSEIDAPILDQMVRNKEGKFEVGILIFSDHTARIKTLYLNGQPLADGLK